MITLEVVDGEGKLIGEEDFSVKHIVSCRSWPTKKVKDPMTAFFTTDRRRILLKMNLSLFKKLLKDKKDESRLHNMQSAGDTGSN